MSSRDDLELRVVEGQPSAEVLDLAGDHDLGADREPTLDEAAPEPGRVDRCRVSSSSRAIVRWIRPRKSARHGRRRRAPAPTRPSRRAPRRGRRACASRAGRRSAAAGGRAGRGRVEVEPDAGPSQGGPGGQAGLRQRGRQQLDRVGRDRVSGSSPWPRLLGCDQVPVVRLAAVADLDLDAGRPAADPLGHRLRLGRGRRRRRRTASAARSPGASAATAARTPSRGRSRDATSPSSGSSAIVWPRLTL